MKKKNSSKTLYNKKNVRTIPKLIMSKLAMLIGTIVPISAFIAYSMNEKFFSVTKILSAFILIISIAAFLKDEIIYAHPLGVHHGNKMGLIKEQSKLYYRY